MAQLIEIGPENFEVYGAEILAIEKVSFPSPWSINAFRAETEKAFSHLWVLISDREVSGYICFWILEGEIHLMNLAVHPEKRGNRLGQLLVTGMIEKGVKRGIKNAWLEVRLYKKMGFHEAGIRPRYYSETNEDAIIMSLELSASGSL
jgi:ribosomal-protein-alanine N-acetyltransferase